MLAVAGGLLGLIACDDVPVDVIPLPARPDQAIDVGPESVRVDADGDSISDFDEAAPIRDADGDGTPDYLDLDSDGDHIGDRDEAGDGQKGWSARIL